MAMAVAIQAAILAILALTARADDTSGGLLLRNINNYRSSIGVPPFSDNKGASCLADKLANRYENRPCDNITQAETTADGLEPNFPEYPKMLSDCKLQVQNTSGGEILVDCVPRVLLSTAVDTVTQNFTRSQQYQRYINSTDYVSAGAASEDLWFVLVLANGQSDGSFAQVASGSSKATASGGFLLLSLILALYIVRDFTP